MPIYEYQCKEGHGFEKFRPMDKRHNVLCPECGEQAHIIPSICKWRQAMPLPVFAGDGTHLKTFRDVPLMRPPTPPEELVRIGELNNSGSRGLR